MNHWLIPGPVFMPLHQEPTPWAHISTWFQPAEWCLTPQAGPAFPVGPRVPVALWLTQILPGSTSGLDDPPQSTLLTEKILKNIDQITTRLCAKSSNSFPLHSGSHCRVCSHP